ncbi:Thymidylate kinase [Erysiphe neolycopersici]|uniref:Thymidylate kinase n=1 Tax=Erysiphe neolycopersici TaxID=212602 RepID=A0A420HI54_9PEZI|nr:Thymidylate kinase [Erysiphe neolycopersici]
MTSPTQGQWPWQQTERPVNRGALIVIEGLDRAGKTTQVKRVCDKLYLLGHNVKTLRFPDRTTSIGLMINNYLQTSTDMDDHTIHLLFSANRWERAKWIKDNIMAGYTIICDRYYLSGIAYSVAKNNSSLTLEWASASDIGLPCPDAIIFLDISPEEGQERTGFGTEKYEKKEFQQQIRKIFLQLLSSVPYKTCARIIDAGQSISHVENQILDAISDVLESTLFGLSKNPIGKIPPGKEQLNDVI